MRLLRFARNDKFRACRCEERGDEAISTGGKIYQFSKIITDWVSGCHCWLVQQCDLISTELLRIAIQFTAIPGKIFSANGSHEYAAFS